MKKYFLFFLFSILFFHHPALAQNTYIYTKEGRSILNRRSVIENCLQALRKDKSDAVAVSICECQTDKINRNFSYKQYLNFKNKGIIDLSGLIKTNAEVAEAIQQCYTNSGQTVLLQAQGFEAEFILNCAKNIQHASEKTYDTKRVNDFCNCQLSMVKSKKITDEQMQTLTNPNSLLFYEMMFTCGDPFTNKSDFRSNWTTALQQDVKGPDTDTLTVLNLNSMTYVKARIGSKEQVWLFDTGASDLLIDKDTEEQLKEEKVMTAENYLGIGEYEMANGMVDTCRKYRINNVKIGKFTLNNIMVAVTDKGKRIIVGKALMNKFSQWVLSNKENSLVLSK